MASSSTSNSASAAKSTKEPTPGDGPAAGDAGTTGAFASRARQASDALQTLEKALANISSHKQVFSNVAEAVDRHAAREIELQDKDAEIARLESTVQTNFDQLTKRYSQWADDKKGLEEIIKKKDTTSEAKLKVVEQDLKALHAQEVEKFKKSLENEKKKSAALELKLGEAKSRIKRAEDELVRLREQLGRWNGYVSEMEEVDFEKLETKIKPLSDRCCALARNHFFRDLAPNYFQDQTQWEKLPRTLDVRLTFPPSNSPVAKYVRMAACLHIISRSLCEEIFKPCYIPTSIPFSNGIKDILANQLNDDEAKERITRALILSTYSTEATTTAMTQAARISSTQIHHLLTPLGANERFAKELEKIFLDAGEIWKNTAQHSNKLIEALTEDDPEHLWATIEEFTIQTNNNTSSPTTTTTTTTTTTPTTPSTDANNNDLPLSRMLNLFPCIYVPEDDKILFSGVTLLYRQGIVSAAEQEFTELLIARRMRSGWNNPNSFSGGPTAMRRERRMSSAPDGRGRVPATSSAAADEATQQRGTR